MGGCRPLVALLCAQVRRSDNPQLSHSSSQPIATSTAGPYLSMRGSLGTVQYGTYFAIVLHFHSIELLLRSLRMLLARPLALRLLSLSFRLQLARPLALRLLSCLSGSGCGCGSGSRLRLRLRLRLGLFAAALSHTVKRGAGQAGTAQPGRRENRRPQSRGGRRWLFRPSTSRRTPRGGPPARRCGCLMCAHRTVAPACLLSLPRGAGAQASVLPGAGRLTLRA